MEILLGSGGTLLTIAQRFNAGHYAFVFVLSPIGTTETFFRPLRDSTITSLPNPALKRWAIVNSRTGTVRDGYDQLNPFQHHLRKLL
jgi:hypothetical protein